MHILNKIMKLFCFNVLFIHYNYSQNLQTDYEIFKAGRRQLQNILPWANKTKNSRYLLEF